MQQQREGVRPLAGTDRPQRTLASSLANGALLLLPGALIVYLGFNAGGFFPYTPAVVTIVLLAVLAVRICVARNPFSGLSRPLAIAAGALGLYTVWTLLSGTWSNAPARALIEFDRALLYLVTLVLFGSLGRTTAQLRWMLRGVALGIAIVCLAGLITRVLPEVWSVSPGFLADRLSYPVTYWNSLGIMASVGLILCFHLTSSRGEPRLVRVLAAGVVPPLAATLLFTFSRGGIAAGAIGILTYVFLARPRALLSGLLATVAPASVSVIAAYNADLLASENPTSAGAVNQGHDVALVVALCTVGAALVRWALVWFDGRPLRTGLSPRAQARLGTAAWYGLVSILIVGSLALNVPGYVGDQYDRFVHTAAPSGSETRQRLFNPSNNGRLAHWDVALDAFGDAKLHGEGAGTYQLLWAEHRPRSLADLYVRDAHSLYVEVLGELGIVGILLLLVALGTIFVRLGMGLRGPNRALYGALFAAIVTLALHAGVDWDWEMPVVMIWLFALGGMALAAPTRGRGRSLEPSGPVRALVGVVLVLLVLVPAHVAVSQGRLDDSLDAYRRGDCKRATEAARSSSSVLGTRPEPHEVIGYCYLRRGLGRRAIVEMEKAVARDPDNWEYRYDLALARGASGIDPRPAARAALRLDPLEELIQEAQRRFDTADSRKWKRTARALAREIEL
jgi:O-antigen ligase